MHKKYSLQELQKRLVVETSENRPVYLLLVGNPPKYIRLSVFAYELLYENSLGKSFEEISEIVRQKTGKNLSPSEVEAAYQKVISDLSEIEENKKTSFQVFYCACHLYPKKLLIRLRLIFLLPIINP